MLPKKSSKEKKRERYKRHYAGPLEGYDHGNHIRTLPCAVPVCWAGPVHAAHVKSRGAGGTWRDLVPLCMYHHREYDDRLGSPRRFMEKYDVDLVALAKNLADLVPDPPPTGDTEDLLDDDSLGK
jgi:hypothetical protein